MCSTQGAFLCTCSENTVAQMPVAWVQSCSSCQSLGSELCFASNGQFHSSFSDMPVSGSHILGFGHPRCHTTDRGSLSYPGDNKTHSVTL